MFEFLKDWFSGGPTVEIVGYEKPEVVLKATKPLELGQTSVRAKIGDYKIKALVMVTESGLDECRAIWLEPKEALPLLIEAFQPDEKRRNPRFKRRLRVRSPVLPHFQGNTLDLSKCGMRLEAHGEVPMGEFVPLAFELDDASATEVHAQGVVKWVAPAERDGFYAVGLEFEKVDKPQSYDNFLDRISHDVEL